MSDEALFSNLRDLELALHRPETRGDSARLQSLLHPDFEEIARSGRRYSRDETLAEFADGSEPPMIASRNFRFVLLGDDVALLTYESAHVNRAGDWHRRTLRSSLWLRDETGWRLRFHQGTPADDPA
ncbi:MAG TPA: nuclear transport factor 2 family protein [Gammaproteobacteria bacterium]|nr:nuclear transport factor 2 family protein [Gammaproteobacteria bacterium]